MKYNINPILHKKVANGFDTVSSDYYDTLLIIAPLYDSLKEYNGIIKDSYAEKTYQYLLDTIELINKNDFKNIVFFDNYDYDYDPTGHSNISPRKKRTRRYGIFIIEIRNVS